MNKFWLVWKENGPAPSKKHNSETLALAEADRLASKQVGDKFYVMSADICVSAEAVLTTHNMVDMGYDPEEQGMGV